jgi:voltage-gated potassium channel
MGSIKRLKIAVALLLGVYIYGTVGQYILLHSKFGLFELMHRTMVMMATINEPYTPDELGELYTPAYRAFMISLVLFGITAIMFSLSTITAFFVEGELNKILRTRKMNIEISKMTNHYIICGAGELGHIIAREFKASNQHFVIIENDPAMIEKLEGEGFLFVKGDAAEDDVLRSAGIELAKGMAITLPNDHDNLFVTISARQLNPQLRIIARGTNPKTDQKFMKAGADKVVSPAGIAGMRMASELIRPSAVSFMDKMLRDPVDPTRIEEVVINASSPLSGKTIATSQFRQKTRLQVVAIRQPGEPEFSYDPQPDAALQSGTVLVVIGKIRDVVLARELAGMK